jgi:hypothetical protein
MIRSLSVHRPAILAILAFAVPFASAAERSATDPRRPEARVWARELDATFRRLPLAEGRPERGPTTAQSTCDRCRAVFESAQARLLPTPTPELDRAFTEYLDALLALYRECPKERGRALELHPQANRLGARFQGLVNRTLDAEAARRRASPLRRVTRGI